MSTPVSKPADVVEEWTLHWSFGAVTVQALGGMLAPLTFQLPNGQTISPLQVAPWGSPVDPALPGVLRKLRGEWPCIPYGASRPPADLPPGWLGHAADDAWDHGFTANHDWTLIEQTDSVLRVGIDYPPGHGIARLERTVRPDPHSPSIEVELTVFVRATVCVPLALHPTFAVPPQGLEIAQARATRIYTYPVPTEPGVSRLTPNTFGDALDAMPVATGVQDFTHLPLPFATEELMQMVDCKPPFCMRYSGDAIEVRLDWDTAVLPDALIWISNGGRTHAPWSGRHFALGIEPMHGFFDLGRVVTPGDEHPLAAQHGIEIQPDNPLKVRYAISASSY